MHFVEEIVFLKYIDTLQHYNTPLLRTFSTPIIAFWFFLDAENLTKFSSFEDAALVLGARVDETTKHEIIIHFANKDCVKHGRQP